MRLISWNIAGRGKACDQQLEALTNHHPDCVALQEVRPSVVSKLRQDLAEIGLTYAWDSTDLAASYGRPYGVLIACHWPLARLSDVEANIPFPERALSTFVASPWGNFELHTAHIPPGASNGWKKIETFEGIYQYLARHSDQPRILCGDFNSPQAEKPDGRVITWGERETKSGRIIIVRGHDRWDAGERSVIVDLARFDLQDIYRQLNGYEEQTFSWFLKRKSRILGRRFDPIFGVFRTLCESDFTVTESEGIKFLTTGQNRFQGLILRCLRKVRSSTSGRFTQSAEDPIFESKKINPTKCWYIQSVYQSGLSDHAAIAADFAPVSW